MLGWITKYTSKSSLATGTKRFLVLWNNLLLYFKERPENLESQNPLGLLDIALGSLTLGPDSTVTKSVGMC